ncbi:MAG: SPOR domain-containing protein [Acidobacteriota bacterium]
MNRAGFRSVPWRQVLWIGAGSVALAFVVAAASWLFTPRPSSDRVQETKPIQESLVERRPFVQESAAADPKDRDALPESPATPEDPFPAPTRSVPEASPSAPIPAPVPTPPPSPTETRPVEKPARAAGVSIQLGAFGTPANARELAGRLKAMGYGAQVASQGGRHKVLIPGFQDRKAAEKALQDLKRAGFSGAFVVTSE